MLQVRALDGGVEHDPGAASGEPDAEIHVLEPPLVGVEAADREERVAPYGSEPGPERRRRPG